MQTYMECIPCFFRQALDAMNFLNVEKQKQQNVIREVAKIVQNIDYTLSPPQMGVDIHRFIKKILDDPDPYKKIKLKHNKHALGLLDKTQLMVGKRKDQLEASVKAAIAGNIIDLGVCSKIDEAMITEELDRCLDIDIDQKMLRSFKQNIKEKKSILYLGDNAGEIVFDMILLKRLPINKVVYAVRGKPIINDATLDDAKMIGLTALVKVIDNGSDYPGTVLSNCSNEFVDTFNKSDLVIAKGQGNYETLSHVKDKRIFFLFKAKCPVIARDINKPLGSFILTSN